MVLCFTIHTHKKQLSDTLSRNQSHAAGEKKEYSQLESNGVTNDSGNLRRGERQCTSLADRDDMSSCIDEGEREEGSSEGEQLHGESKLKEI